jgi:hypothetical protein
VHTNDTEVPTAADYNSQVYAVVSCVKLDAMKPDLCMVCELNAIHLPVEMYVRVRLCVCKDVFVCFLPLSVCNW